MSRGVPGNEAVEFIINHAEVSIAFVQAIKLDLVSSLLEAICVRLLTIATDIPVSWSQSRRNNEGSSRPQ